MHPRTLHQYCTELHGSSRVFPIYPIARSSRQSQISVGSQRAGPYGDRDMLRRRFERPPSSVIVRSNHGEYRDVCRTSDRHRRGALETEDRSCADGTVEVNALRLHRARFVPKAATPWTATRGLACVRGPGVDGNPPEVGASGPPNGIVTSWMRDAFVIERRTRIWGPRRARRKWGNVGRNVGQAFL